MGGGLYETFDHIGTIFPQWHLVTAETCPMFYMFYSRERSILRKKRVLPMKNLSFALPMYAIMLQHLIIQFMHYYLSSGHLREIKNKRKFQTFSSKSGHSHIQEVPNIVN